MLDRKSSVLQGLLSLHPSPRYLEIGVRAGERFHAVDAARKVAVDPVFKFSTGKAREKHPEASYHEVTSDTYFGQIAAPSDKFDVIFLDGLHTFEQTLRDFTNSIHFLSEKGTILIDDVVPVSYFASIGDLGLFRTLRQADKEIPASWMGDVYRLVYFIETFFQQYRFRTTTPQSQLVIWRGRRESVPDRSVEAVARTGFERVLLDKELYRFAPFEEILNEIRASLHNAANVSSVPRRQ
jgi:Methyltransferase domain